MIQYQAFPSKMSILKNNVLKLIWIFSERHFQRIDLGNFVFLSCSRIRIYECPHYWWFIYSNVRNRFVGTTNETFEPNKIPFTFVQIGFHSYRFRSHLHESTPRMGIISIRVQLILHNIYHRNASLLGRSNLFVRAFVYEFVAFIWYIPDDHRVPPRQVLVSQKRKKEN